MPELNILPCQQLGLDNNWSLTRLNACHIGNQNAEMGSINDKIITIDKTMVDMSNEILRMSDKLDLMFWFNGIITVAIIGTLISMAIKKIFGKTFK